MCCKCWAWTVEYNSLQYSTCNLELASHNYWGCILRLTFYNYWTGALKQASYHYWVCILWQLPSTIEPSFYSRCFEIPEITLYSMCPTTTEVSLWSIFITATFPCSRTLLLPLVSWYFGPHKPPLLSAFSGSCIWLLVNLCCRAGTPQLLSQNCRVCVVQLLSLWPWSSCYKHTECSLEHSFSDYFHCIPKHISYHS